MWGLNSWCWPLFLLYVGMHYLDATNRWLVYGRQTILPFYLLHHPAIIAIAFFVVQWHAGIAVKWPVVVLGSILVTPGLVEVVKRMAVFRALLGIKIRRREMRSAETG